MSETREVRFDDGTELIIDKRGSKIYIAQRVWHMNIDGSEVAEEWHVAEGEIVVPLV